MTFKTLILSFITMVLYSSMVLGQEIVSVKVFPDIKRQKIQSIGGNYCQARLTNSAWDAIGEATLKEFKPGSVRVALPLKLRNEEYTNYKGDKICQQPLVISVLETVKRMKYEFGVKTITISVWDVPDEL